MWLVETIQVWVFCHRLDWTISTYAAMLFRGIVGNYFHLIEVYTVACKELWFRPSSLYQYLEDASLAITTAPSLCTYLSQVCKRCSAFFKKKKKKTQNNQTLTSIFHFQALFCIEGFDLTMYLVFKQFFVIYEWGFSLHPRGSLVNNIWTFSTCICTFCQNCHYSHWHVVKFEWIDFYTSVSHPKVCTISFRRKNTSSWILPMKK